MRIERITFSLGRSMPLYPISKDKADEYANVKPFVSCTIAFDADDAVDISKANFERAKEIVTDALFKAQGIVFEQVSSFSKDFRELYEE